MTPRQAYETGSCSAVFGVFLFKHDWETPLKPSGAVRVYYSKKLVTVYEDIEAAEAGLNRAVQENWSMGRRYDDLPEAFGIVTDLAGNVTHRHTGRRCTPVSYLGHYHHDQEVASNPCTAKMLGLKEPV